MIERQIKTIYNLRLRINVNANWKDGFSNYFSRHSLGFWIVFFLFFIQIQMLFQNVTNVNEIHVYRMHINKMMSSFIMNFELWFHCSSSFLCVCVCFSFLHFFFAWCFLFSVYMFNLIEIYLTVISNMYQNYVLTYIIMGKEKKN